MIKYVMMICALLVCFIGGVSAQVTAETPLVTPETLSDLALLHVGEASNFYLLQTRPILLQEFISEEGKRDWYRAPRHLAIINLETGQTVATLETSLGLISANERYMMAESLTGFAIWDLETAEEVFRLEVAARMVGQLGHLYGVIKGYSPTPVPPLGTYDLFIVDGTQAIVGNNTLFHIIDLAEGQETDRFYNTCAVPEWLLTLLEGSCEASREVRSPFQADLYGISQNVLSYPANNLTITKNSAQPLATLDTQTLLSLPMELRYSHQLSIGASGHVLGVYEPYTYGVKPRNLQLMAVFPCQIRGGNTGNVRIQPSVGSEALGHMDILYGQENIGVSGQSQQADGLWWRLATGAWVRHDVIQTEGDCSAVPVIAEP